MPSSDDYLDAGRTLRSMSAVLLDEARAVTTKDLVAAIGEGPIIDQVVDSVTGVRTRLDAAARELVDLARRCEGRAEVCLGYERAWREHLRLPLHQRITTPPPARPAPWVG